MYEFGDDPAIDLSDEVPTLALLQAMGEALLLGMSWEAVLADRRWAHQSLYIVYNHDPFGTPDRVEDTCLDAAEAALLTRKAARYFYRCRLTEWRLEALAVREAGEGFQRDVIRCLVKRIKAALQAAKTLPKGVCQVTVGAGDDVTPAYLDIGGRRIVLWEDARKPGHAGDSIPFGTLTRPPRCGLMNTAGDIIVPAAFQEVMPLHEGLAVARRNGRYGYIDAAGCVVVPFTHEAALDCCQERLLVKCDGLWGALDCSGKFVIPACYDRLEHDTGNAALRATLDDRHGYLSLDGALLVGFCDAPLQLAEHSFATERAIFIARSEDGGRQTLVDAQGRQIGAQAYAAIRYGLPDQGLLCAQQRGNPRYGYINLHGDPMIPFHFADAGNFSEGLAAAAPNETPARYGYIDRHGNWVIAPAFALADEFHEGLAAAAMLPEDKPAPWRLFARHGHSAPAKPHLGYIDRGGDWVIDPQFLDARPFCEGMAAVLRDAGWSYIDAGGGNGIGGPFHEAGPFRQGVARVARRYSKGPPRWGLIDASGFEIIPLRFDRLSYPRRGLISARDEYGLWGCLTLFGNIVLPFVYRDWRDLRLALATHCGADALPS